MPTSDSIQALTGGGVQDAVQQGSQGLSGAAAMAQKLQQLDSMQTEQQQNEQKLQQMKWNSNKDMLNTYLNASDGVRKAMKKQIGSRLQKNGADPLILDSLDNEDMAKSYRSALDAYGKDPEAAAKGLAIMAHVGAFEQTIPSMGEVLKQRASLESARALKEAQLEVTKRGQDIGLEKAKLFGGVRLDAREADAVKGLVDDPQVKPIQQNIQQAKKDFDLIAESRAKGLTPLKATELVQSYVGLLKGMSARSVGAEREELAHAASDLEQKFQMVKQKWTQSKGMIKYQDEPFLHDIEDGVRGLHGTLKDSLQTQLNAKLRTSGLPSVNNAQQAAYNEMMKGAELGYKPPTKQLGASGFENAPQPAQTPAPAQLTPGQQTFMQKAQALKKPDGTAYSQDEIMSMMQKKGIR